jgi:hypothetical protein
VDVCKFKLKAGKHAHCLGCGMTKPQKKAFKTLDGGKARARFVAALMAQQAALGHEFKAWRKLYGRKLDRKGAAWPA